MPQTQQIRPGQMADEKSNRTDERSSVARPIDATNTKTQTTTDVDLLQYVFGQFQGRPPGVTIRARRYAEDLGLGRTGAYWGFNWDVLTRSSTELGTPQAPAPIKHEHSGDFDWIGPAKDGIPQYLWDSVAYRTVEATPERLQRYVAVSWTWGRYQLQDRNGKPAWRRTTGTDWRVPVFEPVPTHFGRHQYFDRLTHLKHLLKAIKGFRYFWVDLLCINQGSDKRAQAERKQEIAKQAHIFAKASASIAYLWTLDEHHHHDLSRSLAAFGALLSTCIHFRPDQQVFDGKPAFTQNALPSHKEWAALFTRLKNDNWFTSLWALQEMVLFPSALWMTQDGTFCTLNGLPVTTRLFATCVRLLLCMLQVRRIHWAEAETRYMQSHGLDYKSFLRLRRELETSDHRHQKDLSNALEEQANGIPGYMLPVVETSSMFHIPSIIRNRQADQTLEQEIFRWEQWSFGTASIDISLRATRTAILVAGNNREVLDNQSKEYALLAALKISHHAGLVSKGVLKADGNYFSPNLLNLIMQKEGARLFDVVHGSFVRPFKSNSHAVLDTSEWQSLGTDVDYLQVEYPGRYVSARRNSDDAEMDQYTKIALVTGHLDSRAQYQRNGVDEFACILRTKGATLTDVSPCSAHRVNQERYSPCTGESIRAEDLKGWHMHHASMLHIPTWAKVQQISKSPNGTFLILRVNGGSVEYTIERLRDLKHVWSTQKWMEQSLGHQPKFMFLPLYTRSTPPVKPSRYMNESYVALEAEETVGMVLVGKTELRKDTPMTFWYKLGTYRGQGPTRPLGWKGGIIATSPFEEQRMSQVSTKECDELTLISKSLNDQAESSDEGFEMIRHTDVLEGFQSRTNSSIPASMVASTASSVTESSRPAGEVDSNGHLRPPSNGKAENSSEC